MSIDMVRIEHDILTISPTVQVERNGPDLILTEPSTGSTMRVCPYSKPDGLYSQALLRVPSLDNKPWGHERRAMLSVSDCRQPLTVSHLDAFQGR